MTNNLVYDNDGYIVVEALVQAATGRSIVDWVLELIAKPLNLTSMLRCMEPSSPHDVLDIARSHTFGSNDNIGDGDNGGNDNNSVTEHTSGNDQFIANSCQGGGVPGCYARSHKGFGSLEMTDAAAEVTAAAAGSFNTA